MPTHDVGTPQRAARRALMALASGALATSVLTTAPAGGQPTGDAEAGKAKAALCVACHGRDGERVEPTMQPFVAALTDQDVEDIAAYYASLSPCP